MTSSTPPSATAMLFARLRLHGSAALGGTDLVQAEQLAETVGRTIVHVETPTGHEVTLGWPVAAEPAPITRGGRLARRELRGSAVRALVVAYAILTDPHRNAAYGELRTASMAEVVEQTSALFGSATWTMSALRRDLPNARLLAVLDDEVVVLGPAALAWDRYQREVMDRAAARLYASPLWSPGDQA